MAVLKLKYIKSDYYFLGISIILLIPIIFHPIFNDLSIYITAGKIIYNGGKIYVDYIDLKPPLFYYFYAFIYMVTSGTEMGIRIFDFIWQILTLLTIFKITKRLFDDNKISCVSVILYSLSYSALSIAEVMHTESFVSLPILLIIYLEISYQDYWKALIAEGILLGFITGFKFTYAIVLFSLIINDFINNKKLSKAILYKYLVISGSALVVFLISLSPLSNPEILSGYEKVLRYLRLYVGLPKVDSTYIKDSIIQISALIGDKYSVSLTVFTFAGIFKIIVGNSESRKQNGNLLILTTFLILFISILIERKLNMYFFVRLYSMLAIFSAIGIVSIYKEIKERFSNRRMSLLILPLFCFGLLFSPLPRYLFYLQPVFYYFTDTNKYDSYFPENKENINYRVTYKQIEEYLVNRTGDNDNVLVISIGGNPINYFLKHGKISKFSQSCFYFSIFPIPEWEQEIIEEIKIAKFIIIQTNDKFYIVNGHTFTSWESFCRNRFLVSYLNENFNLVREFYPYKIFENKQYIH